ncbi:MAG TPA: hypothetical protein PKO12_09155, partial [Holophaga sp.]|nr:hypothetical protein [Holophaga sp.]
MKTTFKAWASRLKMPHTLVIVGSLVALVLVLSWIIPSGEFQRVDKLLPDGSHRSVPVPGSFQFLPKTFLGLHHLFLSPIQGFESAGVLVAFLLIIGGSFNIL